MNFGRRQTRLERAGAVAAPPLQPDAPPSGNQQHCANAASDIVALLLAAYTVQRRLQVDAAIAAAAALTGEFALRATGVPIPDKGTVSGDAVNDVLFAGAQEGRATAWMFIMHAAMEAGVAAYDLPRIEALAAAFAQADGEMVGSFSVRYPQISTAMVSDKTRCIAATEADAVVSTDAGCLMNIGGRLRREEKTVRIMHLAELLDSR